MFSSWDVVLPQGAPTKADDGAAFRDGSAYAKAQAQRVFNAIADDFTMEFTMKMSADMEDTVIDLKNEDTTAIRFTAEDDKLLVGGEKLCAVPVDTLKTFKLHISPANGTYTISVNGATIMDGDAAKEFAFENSTDAIDRLYIETGVEEMGQVVIGTVRVYVDYYVNEKFLDGVNLAINDEWTVTGDAATIYKKGTQGPDKYNALLGDGDSISRDVAYEQDGAWVEFQQLMEVNQGEFAMILSDDAGNELKVATKDGKFGYYNGTEFVGLYDCLNNMWYHVKIEQTEDGTELYLNHKLKADNLPNVKFTNMAFAMTGGEAMLDDIVVKDWIPLPEDYVPAPVAVEKEEGAKLVGMQSCNLWVEGEHFGYDWLTDWEERTPILGYYDEISTESADWELKFKIEHGIDFELYCWYRAQDGQNEPIKLPRNSRALHEGYMNAEYSEQMKFAITWESGSGGKDLADFKDYIVPYWIEQYFKDDRYMVIDNKPLIGMYNIDMLKKYFGDITGVKEAMDYLREACREAGFDGAYIIMCNINTSSAQEIAQASFDGQYAYTWGPSSNLVSTQTKGMESMQATLDAAGWGANGVVPTVSQGFWDKAWDRNDGNYASVKTFQEVLKWVKEEFQPTLDQNSIGSKVVLLDNWNEYGEGHFIMPANLAGFGYLDAVKTVFVDEEECEEGVQHLEPTQAQLDRIQHMYIQDRHVVLVDKDGAASDVIPMEGYNWTFEVDGDTEGWAVGSSDGKWIKELKDWAVKDGNFYGLTFTPGELSAKVESGELTTGATADPSLMSSDNLGLNASQAIAIKIRMKGVGGLLDPVGKPAIYFITEDDQKWNNNKMVSAFYEEGTDGYAELTFNMTTNTLWTGTIKQIRFDPIERDGKFWVDSIQIMKRVEGGDAEIYMDGERVYTAAPVETVDGEYMFPVDELEALADAYIFESLAKDRLYINTDTVFYEFPYEGDTKMRVNGVAVDSVGVIKMSDMLYVPIVDVFENTGTVTDTLGKVHPAYTVTVTPATADAKTKIEIEKYVDPTILKGYYFSTSTDSWTYGGVNTTKTPAINGAGAIVTTANGSDTRLWSPEATANQFNVSAQKADHIRMRVTTDAATETPTFKMDVFGDGQTYSYTYNITLTEDKLGDDGFYTVLIDLADAKAAALKHAQEIDRVRIYWYDSSAGGTQTFAMDSFELLDIVEDSIEEEPEDTKVVIEESPYTIYDWDFAESKSGWTNGGLTGLEYDNELEALKVTCNPHSDIYRMDVWSSTYNDTNKKFANPLNISAADATHVLIRIQTEEEVDAMALTLQYVNEDGSLGSSVDYTAEYVTDINGDLYALVDLTGNAAYDIAKTIGRFNVFPIGKTVGEADNGKVVNITSVEILDKNWYIEFDSTYFTNGRDGWIKGGYTQLSDAEQTLVVAPPTTAGDYNPRIWSLNNSGGVVNGAYEYTKDDVTHVRVRLKAVIPEELPDTMTDGEKAALAEITSEDLRLVLEFTDSERAYVPSLSYNIGTEDYETLTFDVSSNIWPEGKKLARISLEMYDGGNEYLCKAGATVMIDSVQFLRRTSENDESQPLKVLIIGNSITQHDPNLSYGWAADWGMAATSADKDYVHLLEDSILAKNGAVEVKAVNITEYEKYFYDWSLINDPKDKYANWNADIIIATFGANVKNGANESDSSYENDYIFSPDKYKKIIDKFNPDGDATVIAGATVLTREEIVKVIREAAAEYSYTYVDMTEWTANEYKAYDYEDEILAYYKLVTGDTTKTEVYEGVLSHPGDLGMEKIAEELWGKLEPMIPQGIPAEDEDPDEGGEEESDILKAFYFTNSQELWESGGLSSEWQEDGTFLMDFTGQTNTGAGWKSPTGAANLLGLDPSQVGSIVITVKVADGVVPDTAELKCFIDSHTTSKLETTAKYELVEGNTYKVTFDTSQLGANCGEGELLNSVRINGMKVRGDATQGKYYLDSVEFKYVGEDEGNEEDGSNEEESDILKAFDFTHSQQLWESGGLSSEWQEDGTFLMDFTGQNNTGAGWKSPTATENLLGLDPSQVGSVVITVKVEDGVVPDTAELKCFIDSHTTSRLETTAKYELVEGNTYKVTFDTSQLGANCGEGELLNSVRINGMKVRGDATQGKYYLDSVEFIRIGDDVVVTVISGGDAAAQAEGDTTYASLAKGYYFDSDMEGWINDGSTIRIAARDLLIVTGADADGARIWSSQDSSSASYNPLNIATAAADTIRIRINTDVENPELILNVEYVAVADDTRMTWSSEAIPYAVDENGWAVVTIDLTASEYHTEEYLLNRLNLYPLGQTEAAKTETANIDYVEVLKKVETPTTPEEPEDPDEGGEEESDILKAFDFTHSQQLWESGGLSSQWQEDGTFLMDFTDKTDTGAGWKSPKATENLLGLDPSQVGSIVITVKVEDGVVPDTAELKCFIDSHTTSRLETTAKYELVEGNTYKVTFDTSQLGANCGEGELLNSVRINGMKVRGDATQGKYYLDSVEFIRIGDDVVVTVISGGDAAAQAEGDTTYASLAKGYYFDSDMEGWINDGSTIRIAACLLKPNTA